MITQYVPQPTDQWCMGQGSRPLDETGQPKQPFGRPMHEWLRLQSEKAPRLMGHFRSRFWRNDGIDAVDVGPCSIEITTEGRVASSASYSWIAPGGEDEPGFLMTDSYDPDDSAWVVSQPTLLSLIEERSIRAAVVDAIVGDPVVQLTSPVAGPRRVWKGEAYTYTPDEWAACFPAATSTGGCAAGDAAECDGACVDLATDAANCGACRNACGVGHECMNASCHGDRTAPIPVHLSVVSGAVEPGSSVHYSVDLPAPTTLAILPAPYAGSTSVAVDVFAPGGTRIAPRGDGTFRAPGGRLRIEVAGGRGSGPFWLMVLPLLEVPSTQTGTSTEGPWGYALMAAAGETFRFSTADPELEIYVNSESSPGAAIALPWSEGSGSFLFTAPETAIYEVSVWSDSASRNRYHFEVARMQPEPAR